MPTPFWNNAEPFSLYQVSFFPILPTLSYKVIFDDIKGARAKRAQIKKDKPKEKKKRSWLYLDE